MNNTFLAIESITLCDEIFLLPEQVMILRLPTDAFQNAVRQSEFAMFDHLLITCLSSPNQQYVQLILVLVLTVNYPN